MTLSISLSYVQGSTRINISLDERQGYYSFVMVRCCRDFLSALYALQFVSIFFKFRSCNPSTKVTTSVYFGCPAIPFVATGEPNVVFLCAHWKPEFTEQFSSYSHQICIGPRSRCQSVFNFLVCALHPLVFNWSFPNLHQWDRHMSTYSQDPLSLGSLNRGFG